MLFGRLLKFLWKLYLIFSLWKISKYNFILLEKFKTPFVCLKCTFVLENVNWKQFKPTYHLMISDIDILTCILTNKCYFLTWIDDYEPKSCTKFDDFRYSHVQSNKSYNWTNNSEKSFRQVNKYPYSVFSAKYVEGEISSYTRLSLSSFLLKL